MEQPVARGKPALSTPQTEQASEDDEICKPSLPICHQEVEIAVTPATLPLPAATHFGTSVSELEGQVGPATANLSQGCETTTALRTELIVQRAEASQAKKYVGHYQCLLDHRHEVSPVRPEVTDRAVTFAALPCVRYTPQTSRNEASTTGRRKQELSATSVPEILRPGYPIPRVKEETQPRTKAHVWEDAHVTHGWSSRCSHAISHPRTENGSDWSSFPATSEEWELSSDPSELEMDKASYEALADEEQISSGLSAPEIENISFSHRELLTLRYSFSNPFDDLDERFQRTNHANDNDAAQPNPLSPAQAALPKLAELDGTDSQEESGRWPPRTPEAIYRFRSPRIEAVPAVFRIPLPGLSLDYTPTSPLAEAAALKMHEWQWCSVPDLRLRDPRAG
jgi:hypothetical protein